MPTNLHTLDYVILLCENVAPMKTFYQEVLGFPVERDWEDWIELRAGAVLLTLRKRRRPYDGQIPRGAVGVQLAFRVRPPEVDEWYDELLRKQVEILEPPRDRDYGHRTLFFNDPEGNILEIYADI
jgi:catechol 2,3-dioxygenase-like lactoylglutathione lyase family enzyme